MPRMQVALPPNISIAAVPPPNCPSKQPLPQNSFTDTTCVGGQRQYFPTSTNIHRQRTTNASHLLSKRSHRAASCIQRRISALQPTHQSPHRNNAIHKPASSHALPAKFTPCRTNAPNDRYVITNLNPDAHPPPHKPPATA